MEVWQLKRMALSHRLVQLFPHCCCDRKLSLYYSDEIFCIHAGLSPSIKVLDQVKGIDRVRDVGTVGVLADLLWSDPDENTEYWAENNRRGCAYLFGEKIVNQFNHLNNLKLIARGHQL